MTGIHQVAGAAQAIATPAKPQSGAASAPFSGMFHAMMRQTAELESDASRTVGGLLNGSGVEIHEAMIATQKADMAFELALQVRNKAVAAYQQMMTMQF